MNRMFVALLIAAGVTACGPKELQPDADFVCDNCASWNESQTPFRIYGNTWYVGVAGLSSILIESSDGLILLDGGLPQSAEKIVANIREAGFDPLTIKAILVSHAHYDHAGGVAAIQRMTGAAVYMSDAGAVALRSGTLQEDDPQYLLGEDNTRFPAVRNVTAVADGALVTVGDVDLKLVHTPGHTPGSSSWTWESCALDTCYDIVYADSLTAVSAPGYRFSEGPAASQLVESAGAIADLDCDILLSPHPFFFGMQDKLEKIGDGNPFVNNVACMIYAETSLGWLEQRLQSEGS